MSFLRVLYKLFVIFRAKKVGSQLHVNGFSLVSKSTELGRNVNFNGIRISGCGVVRIGDNFHSGKDCLIISQNHNYDYGKTIPYDDTYIPKNVTIHDNVWLGERVIVLGGVTIGEGAIIQAGSVVVSDIPACGIAGGHPAKVFRQRNIEHYSQLKMKNKYF